MSYNLNPIIPQNLIHMFEIIWDRKYVKLEMKIIIWNKLRRLKTPNSPGKFGIEMLLPYILVYKSRNYPRTKYYTANSSYTRVTPSGKKLYRKQV